MAGLEGCGCLCLHPCAHKRLHMPIATQPFLDMMLNVCLLLGIGCMTAIRPAQLARSQGLQCRGFENYSPPNHPGAGMCLQRSALQVFIKAQLLCTSRLEYLLQFNIMPANHFVPGNNSAYYKWVPKLLSLYMMSVAPRESSTVASEVKAAMSMYIL